MKINVTLPFDQIENPEEFLQPEAVTQIATLLERLGFEGACVTDHPRPTGRWLDAVVASLSVWAPAISKGSTLRLALTSAGVTS